MSLRTIYDVVAPAKLNLFLHVVGKRADGYHLLQSLFVLIDWHDALHFDVRHDAKLFRHDLTMTLPPDDLCIRAARLLQIESGSLLGVDISVHKTIPCGAGMGGGSSNAASTLLALNRLWNLNWPRSRLLSLGLKLGADVPFFLGGSNAFVEGIGEQLTPVVIEPQRFVVVKPEANIETRALFASPLLQMNVNPDIVKTLVGRLSSEISLVPYGRNDLQSAAEAQSIQIKEAAELLNRYFGNSRMTGSGSAVFAKIGCEQQAMMKLPFSLPLNWEGRICRSLHRHPLEEWI
jgi:4-diphosphocytidyl-2-C-methyl-D-erythritol kinase